MFKEVNARLIPLFFAAVVFVFGLTISGSYPPATFAEGLASEPPVGMPPEEEPPVEMPPVEEPPVEMPPIELPPEEMLPVDEPPFELPPDE